MNEFRGEVLRRAIVLDEPEGSVSAKAQSLELYDDGAVLRWVFPGPYDEKADERDDLWPTLQDDVGTNYRTRGGHGGGNPRFNGEWWFVPGVPDDATRLEVLGLEYPITTSLG